MYDLEWFSKILSQNILTMKIKVHKCNLYTLTYYKSFMQWLLALATAEEAIEVDNECFRYSNLRICFCFIKPGACG